MSKNVEAIYYLSPLQHGMIYHSQQKPLSGVYVEQLCFEIRGTLDVSAFIQAWKQVVNRYTVFRTLFIRLNQVKPMQVVLKELDVPFYYEDWSSRREEQCHHDFEAYVAMDRRTDFDFAKAPLLRLTLIKMGENLYQFMWSYHHCILDGWSMPVVLKNVLETYQSLISSNEDNESNRSHRSNNTAEKINTVRLPPPTSYQHFIAWLAKQDMDRAKAYWRDTLVDFVSQNRLVRKEIKEVGAAPSILSHKSDIASDDLVAAKKACQRYRTTLNVLCQAVWALVVSKYSGRSDVVYGTVVSGRPPALQNVETMVGLFINTLPVRLSCDREILIGELLKNTQQQIMNVNEYSYTSMIDVQKCAEIPAGEELFESIFVFENYPGHDAVESISEGHEFEIENIHAIEETNYPVVMLLIPGETLKLQLNFDSNLIDAEMAAKLIDDYKKLFLRMVQSNSVDPLRSLVAEPALDKPIALRSLLLEQSRTFSEFSRLLSYAEQFDQIVESAGDLVGLRTHSDTYTYEQLRVAGLQAYEYLVALNLPIQATVAIRISDPFLLIALILGHSRLGLKLVFVPTEVKGQVLNELVTLITVDLFLSDTLCLFFEGTLEGEIKPESKIVNYSVICDLSESGDVRILPVATCVEHDMESSGVAEGGYWMVNWNAINSMELGFYTQHQFCYQLLALTDAYPLSSQRLVPLWNRQYSNTFFETMMFSLLNELEVVVIDADHCSAFIERVFDSNVQWSLIRFDHYQTRQWCFQSLSSNTKNVSNVISKSTICVDALAMKPFMATGVGLQEIGVGLHEMNSTLALEYRAKPICMPHSVCLLSRPQEPFPPIDDHSILAHSNVTVIDSQLNECTAYTIGQLAVYGMSVPIEVVGEVVGEEGGQWVRAAGLDLVEGCILNHLGWQYDDSVVVDSVGSQSDWLRDQAYIEIVNSTELRSLNVSYYMSDFVSDDGEWATILLVDEVTFDYSKEPELKVKIENMLGRQGLTIRGVDPALLDPTSLVEAPFYLYNNIINILKNSPYVPPANDTEKKLHRIWLDLLEKTKIGVHDNYFQLGGQSLMATVMMYEVLQQFGVELSIEVLLNGPTIAELARCIDTGDVGATETIDEVNLKQEASLLTIITPPNHFEPELFIPESILLTGATGFLGVQLLADLLRTTKADIFCLVRAVNTQDGMQRIIKLLKSYQLWHDHYESRILVVCGELGQSLFGLSLQEFDQLAETVDVIYHSGAEVNFLYPYTQLKASNVIGTQEVLRLACCKKTKPVHYVSTVGVLDRTEVLIEERLNVPFHKNMVGGYEQSKWVAEQLVYLASQRGLPVAIYRPSRIVGHSTTGMLNEDDLFSRMMKGMVEMGVAPVNAGYDNMVPVDYVSKLIILASQDSGCYGKAFHVINPYWNTLDEVIAVATSLGHSLDLRSYDQWLAAVIESTKLNVNNPLAMLIPVLQKLDPTKDASISAKMPIESCHLSRLLGDDIVQSVASTQDLCQSYFDYFYKNGLIERPVVEELLV